MNHKTSSQCGQVAIIGRPNVGKSTLLNRIIGQKISIVTRKPQTTRQQILGVKTLADAQIIYIDTPGLHKNLHQQPINRLMNRAASAALITADVVVFIITALEWQAEDQWILDKLATIDCPVILAINKADRVKDKSRLLLFIAAQSSKYAFIDTFPLVAKTGHNVVELENKITQLLPLAPHKFPPEAVTDGSQRFILTEIIREKIMRLTGKEVPYAVEVELEEYRDKAKLVEIRALIYVNKPGQKGILIGEAGTLLKVISTHARLDIEKLLQKKVFLRLFVKLKKN